MPPPTPGSEPPQVAQVAVAAPVRHLLSYSIPAGLQGLLKVGQQVRVPLGPRRIPGYIMSLEGGLGCESSDPGVQPAALKPIAAVLEELPSLTPVTLQLGLWVARHYGAAPGEAFQAVLPAPVRGHKKPRSEVRIGIRDTEIAQSLRLEHEGEARWEARRRVLEVLLESKEEMLLLSELRRTAKVSGSPIETLIKAEVLRRERLTPSLPELSRPRPSSSAEFELSDDQLAALEVLRPKLATRSGSSALLHGVTGSGKTEVYLQLIEETLGLGRGIILLVPEIALTPQTVERLSARLPELAVLHSSLSPGDRAHQWERLRRGEVRVAVGPRSAIFAPIEDLGLIIIDEEHETTFKQNNVPRYHTRDVARLRAKLEGCLLLLGSATPSLEAEAACLRGEMTRLSMPKRVAGRPLPRCDILDMRKQKPVAGGILSRPLFLAIERCLDRGEQALLFLNRRGFSTQVLCRRCGWRASCSHCDIHLTHYRQSKRLLCHYCGHEEKPPQECPACAGADILFGGVGTERVAANASQLFPSATVARADAETLRPRGAAERLYEGLKSGHIDVLVGTQVVAKGLDIPNISLVGVISADTALMMPDFRSAERTFQLLCQVAGRAGRGKLPGQVLIQTWCPEQEAIRLGALHDSVGFSRNELARRRASGYPPLGHMARIIIESPDPNRCMAEAKKLREELLKNEAIQNGKLRLLGPAPCPLTLLRGNTRHHLLLLAKEGEVITDLLASLPLRNRGNPRILVDRDPVSMM